jgi:hypothetical protein
VDTGKAKGNDKGMKERNSPMNPNRHGQRLDTGCGGSGLWKCGSAKVDKELKQPILTKSTRSQVVTSRGNLVAGRVIGKTPRGQD